MDREIRSEEPVTEVIIRAVADETRRSPMELQPLADTVDPEALDSLFTRLSGDTPESLTILYEGCRVTVDPGTVTAEEIPTTN